MEITQKQLDNMISDHKKWLDSKGKEGKRFEFHGSLKGCDLSGCDLSFGDLSGADLRSIILEFDFGDVYFNSNLKSCILTGCNLSGTILEGCDLGGATLDDDWRINAITDKHTVF